MARAATLRAMVPADADAVAALHAASWRSAYRGVFPDEFLDHEVGRERQQAWRERLLTPLTAPGWGLVAVDDAQRLAGFAYAMPDHDATWGDYLDNLHVAPELKGGGLGRRLMAAVAQRLRAGGRQRPLYLWVLDANEPAKRFYARLGAELSDHRLSEPLGGQVHPVWRCVWRDPAVLQAHG